MRHLIALFACSLFFFQATAQNSFAVTIQDLEGTWYTDSRTEIQYSVWSYDANKNLFNRTFAVLCGDTLELSSARITESPGGTVMTVRVDTVDNGAWQTFRLAELTDDRLLWQNENPEGRPRQLEWRFDGNNYGISRMDGLETAYRRRRMKPLKWEFRCAGAANLNTFADNQALEKFRSLQRISFDEASYQRMAGQEISLSARVAFPESFLLLNMELGIARRQIGVKASFQQDQIWYTRNGVYDYFNTYLALVPEVFLGRKKYVSLSGGFYFTLAQQLNYRGRATATGPETPNVTLANPRMDVYAERGLLAGLSCRLPVFPRYQPALYVRQTIGLGGNQVRATALGLSFRLGEK